MDRITSMRVFVRAATDGSLSAAARHLDMSPAMAAKHVNALEARLGVKLFHRTTRRLSLTGAGSNYLEACQRILPEIDEAEAAAASQRVKASGLLRMNVPLSFGARFVAPLIPEFAQRHPEVKVELGLSDAQLDLVAGGGIWRSVSVIWPTARCTPASWAIARCGSARHRPISTGEACRAISRN